MTTPNKKMKIKASSIFPTTLQEKKVKKTIKTNTLHSTASVITFLIDFLYKNGKDTEGIFRVNGSVNSLQSLKTSLLSSTPALAGPTPSASELPYPPINPTSPSNSSLENGSREKNKENQKPILNPLLTNSCENLREMRRMGGGTIGSGTHLHSSALILGDCHVVAGLIKLLLRELDEPLLLFSTYDHLLGALDVKEEKAKLQVIKAIIDTLPKDNKSILLKLIDLFFMISQNESVTKMNAHNLAVVMGPTIMRPAGENFETMMSDSGKVVAVVTTLISNSVFFKGNEAITITAPVKLNETEMDKLVHNKPEKKEKRDLKKKYEDLKTKHKDLQSSYDELRTQHSVLEAYNTKVDQKVKELEDMLDTMESNCTSPRDTLENHFVPHFSEDHENLEIQKLRAENESLRDLIIRTTREEVTNIREDSMRLRSPRELASIKSLKESETTNVKENVEKDKIAKQNSFLIKKQNSTRIISKLASRAQKLTEETSIPSAAFKKTEPPKDTNKHTNIELKKVIFEATQTEAKRFPLMSITENSNLPPCHVAVQAQEIGPDSLLKACSLNRNRRTNSIGTPVNKLEFNEKIQNRSSRSLSHSVSSSPSSPPKGHGSWEGRGTTEEKIKEMEKLIVERERSYELDQMLLRQDIKEIKTVLEGLTSALAMISGRLN